MELFAEFQIYSQKEHSLSFRGEHTVSILHICARTINEVYKSIKWCIPWSVYFNIRDVTTKSLPCQFNHDAKAPNWSEAELVTWTGLFLFYLVKSQWLFVRRRILTIPYADWEILERCCVSVCLWLLNASHLHIIHHT